MRQRFVSRLTVRLKASISRMPERRQAPEPTASRCLPSASQVPPPPPVRTTLRRSVPFGRTIMMSWRSLVFVDVWRSYAIQSPSGDQSGSAENPGAIRCGFEPSAPIT